MNMEIVEMKQPIEIDQLLNSSQTNPPVNRRDLRIRSNLIAKLATVATTVVLILVFTGIGFVIYNDNGGDNPSKFAALNMGIECNFSRPSQILYHLMEVNDHLIKGLVAHKQFSQSSKESKSEIANSLISINNSYSNIRDSISDLEKNEGDVEKLKGFGFISTIADMDDVIAKISGLQEQANWIGVAVTSKGPTIVKIFEFTRESFVDKEFCKVSQQDLNQLEKQFGIEVRSEGDSNLINETTLVELNCELKKIHSLLLKRETIYDELVKEFYAHKLEDVDVTKINEKLREAIADDETLIQYFHGNLSIVDRLRESTGIIRSTVKEESQWTYNITISAQKIIQRSVHDSFIDVKTELNSRREDIDKLILPVKREAEDLYARLLLLTHKSATF